MNLSQAIEIASCTDPGSFVRSKTATSERTLPGAADGR
jgi:hypothetical protein